MTNPATGEVSRYENGVMSIVVSTEEITDRLLFGVNSMSRLPESEYKDRPYIFVVSSEKAEGSSSGSTFLTEEEMGELFRTWLRLREEAGNE